MMTVQELADHVGDRIMFRGAYNDPIALMERGVLKIAGDLRGPTTARPSIPSDPAYGAGVSHSTYKDRDAAWDCYVWSDVAEMMGR